MIALVAVGSCSACIENGEARRAGCPALESNRYRRPNIRHQINISQTRTPQSPLSVSDTFHHRTTHDAHLTLVPSPILLATSIIPLPFDACPEARVCTIRSSRCFPRQSKTVLFAKVAMLRLLEDNRWTPGHRFQKGAAGIDVGDGHHSLRTDTISWSSVRSRTSKSPTKEASVSLA